MRALLILISLLSFGLVADAKQEKEFVPEGATLAPPFEPLLEGFFVTLDKKGRYLFDTDTSLVRLQIFTATVDTYEYPFEELEYTSVIYKNKATCNYNKSIVGQTIILTLNNKTTGSQVACDYSIQLQKADIEAYGG